MAKHDVERSPQAAARDVQRALPRRAFSFREAVLALLVLLALVARVSTYHVAQAGSVASSTRDGFVALDGLRDLGPSEHGSLHCPRHDPASRLCEITALEPPDVEKEALLGAPAIGFALSSTPLPSLVSQTPRITSQAWTSQSLRSAALPRGPPVASC